MNENGATTNRIENCWTHLKRMWISTHSGRITKKHLQLYADEFAFRRNNLEKTINDVFNEILQKTSNKKITHCQLMNMI